MDAAVAEEDRPAAPAPAPTSPPPPLSSTPPPPPRLPPSSVAAADPDPPPSPSTSGRAKCFVIVYNVAKKHNIGTLLRSCTAFGVTQVRGGGCRAQGSGSIDATASPADSPRQRLTLAANTACTHETNNNP